jgi:hypothetical protein
MRKTALAVALLLCAPIASAHTTKDFVFRCSQEQEVAACAVKIKEVIRRLENPPPGRAIVKLCLPPDMSDEMLVAEVTYWIDEQGSRYDNRDEDESIAAALVALYSCGGPKGL